MTNVTKNDLIHEYDETMNAYIQEVLGAYNAHREASVLIADLYAQVKSQLYSYDVDTLERLVSNTRATVTNRFPVLKDRLS